MCSNMEMEMAMPSYTLAEWCELRRISRAMFYKLAAEGKAPQTHNVGIKRLISPEADARWLRDREAELSDAPEAA
jgi:predicted DNA-binding transcriptional regulator AlpA